MPESRCSRQKEDDLIRLLNHDMIADRPNVASFCRAFQYTAVSHAVLSACPAFHDKLIRAAASDPFQITSFRPVESGR
ncbi:hypothetical protein D3C77_665250 [compost metagenome]